MGVLARSKPTYHANGRKGSHRAKVRRRAYPTPESLTVLREGTQYGSRGYRQGKTESERRR